MTRKAKAGPTKKRKRRVDISDDSEDEEEEPLSEVSVAEESSAEVAGSEAAQPADGSAQESKPAVTSSACFGGEQGSRVFESLSKAYSLSGLTMPSKPAIWLCRADGCGAS